MVPGIPVFVVSRVTADFLGQGKAATPDSVGKGFLGTAGSVVSVVYRGTQGQVGTAHSLAFRGSLVSPAQTLQLLGTQDFVDARGTQDLAVNLDTLVSLDKLDQLEPRGQVGFRDIPGLVLRLPVLPELLDTVDTRVLEFPDTQDSADYPDTQDLAV